MTPKFLWWLFTQLMGLARQIPARNQHPILIVEDSERDAEQIEDACKIYEAQVVKVETVGLAKRELSQRKFRLVFVDQTLPDGSGLNLIDFMAVKYPGVPVTIVTGGRVLLEAPNGSETPLWSGRDWSIICKGTHSENLIQSIGTAILKSNGVNGHITPGKVVFSTWLFFGSAVLLGIFWREVARAVIDWWLTGAK